MRAHHLGGGLAQEEGGDGRAVPVVARGQRQRAGVRARGLASAFTGPAQCFSSATQRPSTSAAPPLAWSPSPTGRSWPPRPPVIEQRHHRGLRRLGGSGSALVARGGLAGLVRGRAGGDLPPLSPQADRLARSGGPGRRAGSARHGAPGAERGRLTTGGRLRRVGLHGRASSTFPREQTGSEHVSRLWYRPGRVGAERAGRLAPGDRVPGAQWRAGARRGCGTQCVGRCAPGHRATSSGGKSHLPDTACGSSFTG